MDNNTKETEDLNAQYDQLIQDQIAFKGGLEYRMYNLVLYNISPIQQGIQAAHSMIEYGLAFYNTIEYQKWAQVDKTIIILNGGSSITLEKHLNFLVENQMIDLSYFKEPDLFNGITAISFLVDERIWNKEKYPDSLPPLESTNGMVLAIHREFDLEAYKKHIGGEQNYQLKLFLTQFRLA